ncbi:MULTISPECIES: hypothetical protein [Psychrilyobacter]|uniref:Uncharacterized protein n=1 Tax=Psychrilyobacter piezotolerans TaxID=2293438 RepID=A0ABX9KF36_9FUSO|nr:MULTISPECIES: hypothetical protein [Psychrilyobacter]MCS5421575.1 hypothetical protein [Psychrilyobacter sp. S5]NDI78579.1 hypothetical protein [Psychrilyobacter piezotolerans]RDE60283.1 hypothetical protein DV867_11060 [Psychrilyobacter sp. S5]REI40391.1 hypothetical protein DYH56_11060 [Psychrilyobacter piezotolerans]
MFEEFENNFISDIDEIIYKVLTKNDEIINSEIVSWIKLYKEDLKFEIIKKYPKLLNHFDLAEPDIRHLWYEFNKGWNATDVKNTLNHYFITKPTKKEHLLKLQKIITLIYLAK